MIQLIINTFRAIINVLLTPIERKRIDITAETCNITLILTEYGIDSSPIYLSIYGIARRLIIHRVIREKVIFDDFVIFRRFSCFY
jgi:hypothetical protein